MNPNLKYAQGHPWAKCRTRCGYHRKSQPAEYRRCGGTVGWIGSLEPDASQQLQSWFAAFLSWLLESAEGRAEAQAENNHGSWYDVQVASFGLFTGRRDLAHRVLSEIPGKRIARQIKPDGTQPLELARTQPWGYSLFNLQALFDAAALGDHLAIDLWNSRLRIGGVSAKLWTG